MHNGKRKTTYKRSRKDCRISLKSRCYSRILQRSTRLTSPLSPQASLICTWSMRSVTFIAVKLSLMTLISMPTSTAWYIVNHSLSSRHSLNQDKWSTQAAPLLATLSVQSLTDLSKSTKLMLFVLNSSRLISRSTEGLFRRTWSANVNFHPLTTSMLIRFSSLVTRHQETSRVSMAAQEDLPPLYSSQARKSQRQSMWTLAWYRERNQ